MADDVMKVVRRQDDTHRPSNAAREPLPHDVLRELVSSTVWQERAQVAHEVDLPVDLVAVLVHDEEISIRHITYDLHRDISTELLDEAIGLHPEDAPQIAFQVHAPLAALRLKPFNFASPADIQRYLAGTQPDAVRSRAFRVITKSSSNALLPLDELMGSISR